MKIIDKKRVVTIDCTDYNNETLFLGYSSDVNSTLLCFLINSEYLGNNFNYRVVFSRDIAGEDDKSINISNISVEEGVVKCTLPAAITHYSNTDSQQGHKGTLQLFIYEQSSSQNNETTQVELVAASSKFSYIIEDSLNLEAISSTDIDVDLWTDLEDAANKINSLRIDTTSLSTQNNHIPQSSLIKTELQKYATKSELDNKVSYKEIDYEDFNDDSFTPNEDVLYSVNFDEDDSFGIVYYTTAGPPGSAEFALKSNGRIEYRTKVYEASWSDWKDINSRSNSGTFEASDEEEMSYKASGYYELIGNYCNLSGTAQVKAGLSSMIFTGIPYRAIYGASSIEYPISNYTIDKNESYLFIIYQLNLQESVDLCVFPLNTSTFLSDKTINFNISYKYK